MGIKVITKHKRVSYDYFLKEKFEAGLSLVGTEVKSLRQGKVKIAEAHITIDKNEEAWIHNMDIPQYSFGNINNHNETRRRKLLLHKKEVLLMAHKMKSEGLTLVPTMIYFKGNYVKIEIALAKGKKMYDKRDSIAERDAERKIRSGNYE